MENAAAETADKQPTTAAGTRTSKRTSRKAASGTQGAPAEEQPEQPATARKADPAESAPTAPTPAITRAQDTSTAATPVLEATAPATDSAALAATPVLEAATPAVEAPDTELNIAPDAPTPLVPATEVKVPADASTAAAMDVSTSDHAEPPPPATAAADAMQGDESADQQSTATPVTNVPLAASLTDAVMTEAAVEDADAVRYDEPEDEETHPVTVQSDRKAEKQEPKTAQKAASKQEQQSSKTQSARKPEGREPKSAQKAIDVKTASKADGLISASARKRSRDEQSVKDDRKAPRTEHKTDVKDDRKATRTEHKTDARPSHRDREKERVTDREKERGHRANGDARPGQCGQWFRYAANLAPQLQCVSAESGLDLYLAFTKLDPDGGSYLLPTCGRQRPTLLNARKDILLATSNILRQHLLLHDWQGNAAVTFACCMIPSCEEAPGIA